MLRSYENTMVFILGLAQGVLFFDRLSLYFLSPLLARDLGLSNAQLGILSAAMSVTWGSSGFLIGMLSDKLGRQKPILIAGILLFSLCSTVSGLVESFLALIAIRSLMGVFEGPILPISQAVIARVSSPKRVGMNMGMVQNFAMFLIAQFLGPLVLTHLGVEFGWRAAFYLTGAPGLLIAWLVYKYMRARVSTVRPEMERPHADHQTSEDNAAFQHALPKRNQFLCVLLACTLGGWMFVLMTFMPLYATRVNHLSLTQMGVVMSMIGVGGILSAVAVPGLSDRIGRKPALLGASITSFIVPATVLLSRHPPLLLLSAATLASSFTTGCFPLYISIIPSESMPPHRMTAAIGMTSAAAEIVGGIVFPPLSGYAADQFGLRAPFLIMAVLAAIGVILILFLVETAPVRLRLATKKASVVTEAEAGDHFVET